MRRIIGLLLGMSLAVALLGVGLNAALTTPNVTQQITVNGVGIAVVSSTPGIVISGDGTIVCPVVAINVTTTPSGTDSVGCSFTVSTTGIAPSSLSVAMQSDVSVPFTKYGMNIALNGGAPSLYTISTNYSNVATVSTLPLVVQTNAVWGASAGNGSGIPLGDSDLGKVMNITYHISATA
jgi:hypothetical protein